MRIIVKIILFPQITAFLTSANLLICEEGTIANVQQPPM